MATRRRGSVEGHSASTLSGTGRGRGTRRGAPAQSGTGRRRGSVESHGGRGNEKSQRRTSDASTTPPGLSEDEDASSEAGDRQDKVQRARMKTAAETEMLVALKKKGIKVKRNELAEIQDVLEKANAKNAESEKELSELNEQTRNQEAQIEFLTMQLEGVKSGMHAMRMELEAAKQREDQLNADLATAGELTKEISRLEAQLGEERMRTLGIMDQLKQENLEVGNDRRRLRQERDEAFEEAAVAKAEAAEAVESMRIELRTEEARRRNLSRDYEHVSRWMTLVASGRTTWQPGRTADRGSVVEAMTAGRAETVWSRGCAHWMGSIDVADVMRDDFWLGQVEAQAKSTNRSHSGETTLSGLRPVELKGLEGPEGRAGAEPVSAAARAAARSYMSSNMEDLVALLQRHRSSLRHCFLAYCRSWPFGISAELLSSCSKTAAGFTDDEDQVASHAQPREKLTAPAAKLLENGLAEATDGGMTMQEFWRLAQDVGMAHTILNRDDCDLIFLRSNKVIYDREAFYRAVAGDSDGAAARVGGREAETWVQKFQTLDISMSFPQFCEAIIRLAVLHVPRKPWDGRVAQSLRARVEFFLTKNLYPAAMSVDAQPYVIERARQTVASNPVASSRDLHALSKSVRRAQKAAGVLQHSGPAVTVARNEANLRRSRTATEVQAALASLEQSTVGEHGALTPRQQPSPVDLAWASRAKSGGEQWREHGTQSPGSVGSAATGRADESGSDGGEQARG